MSNIVLSLQRVTKTFGGKGDVPLVEIFKGMDFNIRRNEVVGLFSPSGSGKTTFLQIAGLLDSQFSGDIYINGSKVDTKNDFQTSIIRRKNIGFVFQFHHLIQEFSALENIIFPLLFEGISKGIAVRKGQQLLEKVGLGKRMDNRPAELSGGEQQRVAICRAIINEPTLLLADEPTGNLDQSTTSKVMSFLIELIKEHNISAIIASHNPTISQLVDKNAKIADGKIVYD
jgi:lipoprotein-releasing system ATP-binding protein